MIKVKDLIKYIKNHAIGRSVTYPDGWIRGDQLLQIANIVKSQEPLPTDMKDLDAVPVLLNETSIEINFSKE